MKSEFRNSLIQTLKMKVKGKQNDRKSHIWFNAQDNLIKQIVTLRLILSSLKVIFLKGKKMARGARRNEAFLKLDLTCPCHMVVSNANISEQNFLRSLEESQLMTYYWQKAILHTTIRLDCQSCPQTESIGILRIWLRCQDIHCSMYRNLSTSITICGLEPLSQT